jgi:PAS domain S-box-containing protein
MSPVEKILIVDNDPVGLAATRHALPAAGYGVMEAASGQAALQAVNEHRFDLVLMEADLPDMDGFEVCRQIKAKAAENGPFVVFLTDSRTGEDSRIDGLEAGAADYLVRPVSERELLARVRALLRIRAAEQLGKVSALQWQTTFDSVHDAIFLTDADFNIIQCNRAAVQIFGQPEVEIVGQKCYRVVHRSSSQISECPLKQMCVSKGRHRLVFENAGRWLEVNIDPALDADGNFIGSVHVIADITERKQAEAALKASEERYRTLVENMNDIVMEVDAQGNLCYISPNYETLAGYSLKEELGRSGLTHVHPEDQPFLLQKMGQALGSKQTLCYRVQHKNGGWLWIETSGKPYRTENGSLHIISVARDVTERKQAEGRLQNSEAFLNRLIEQSPMAMWISDEQGNLIRLNQACCDVLKITPEEVVGRYNIFQDNLVIEQGFLPQVRAVFERGETAHFEIRYDSSQVEGLDLQQTVLMTLDVTIFAIKDAHGRITNAVIQHNNITEYKQAEKRLRESETRFRQTFDMSPVGIVMVGLDKRFIRCNHAFSQSLGYGTDELVGKTFQEVTFPEDRQIGIAEMAAMLKGDLLTSAHVHKRYLRKDGRVVWGEVTISLLRDAEGRAQYFLAIIQDITMRKQAEAALRESEDKFKYVFDHSPVGESITLVGGKVNVNQAFCEMLGYSPEELKNRTWQELTHPDDIALTQNEINALLSGEKEFVRFNKRYLRKDGLAVWTDISAALRRDQTGTPLYFMTTISDITARIQAEAALRESEANLRGLLDAILESVLLLKPDGSIITINTTTAERLGSTVAQMIGRNVYDFLSPAVAEARRKYTEQVIATGQPVWFEDQRFERTIFNSITPILNASGCVERLAIFGFDITARKQAEEALKESEKRFATIFHANPAAIAITQLDTSQLVDVNETWQEVTGYVHAEAIGCTPAELNLWINPAQREHLIETVSKQGRARGEMQLRRKSGEVRDLLLSAEMIELTGKSHLLTMAQDITERKRSENILAARVRLLQFSATHTLDELLRATLDELEILTGSQVGFYHFLEADQKTLSLQTWSTRTLQEMCTAEGRGHHYDIEEAGIWVDCVRERRPVIHNDYASLPASRRKGMPTRHAKIVRELVVPVFRGEQIVAILGVGNKLTDYTPSDTESVSNFAELAWDIAERKRVEETLRETSERLTHMFANSPTVIYAIDVAGDQAKPSWISENIENILGFGAEEGLRPDWWQQQIYPEDRPEALVSLEHLFDDFYQHVYRFWRKDGKLIWLHDQHRLLRDADGRPWEIIGAWTDITERKQAEDALRQSEAFSQAILENSPIGISVRSRTGRLISANEAWKKIWAIPEKDFQEDTTRQRQVLNFDARDDYFKPYQADLRRVYEQGGHLHLPALQVVHPRPGGAEWVSQHFYAIQDEQGQVDRVVILTEDVSQSKRAEEALYEYNIRLETEVETRTRELREAQERLVRQEKLAMLGQLAGSVSHELRNPLGVINSAVYFLGLIQPDAEDQVKEYLAIIQTEAHNAEKIINDLLDFARVKEGTRESVQVKALMTNVLIRFPVPEGIAVTLDIAENLPALYTDPLQVEQVLGNLVTNACQAMPQGGQLTISATQQAYEIAIAIQDTGIGISPENLKKLFEPLFTTKAKGIGLGLAVSQKLVEANGGRIGVESEVGVGTTFTVYFPSHRESDQTLS